MTKKMCIGLMSGTSLDGLDIVLIEPNFSGAYIKEYAPHIKIPAIQTIFHCGMTIPFEPELKKQIKTLLEGSIPCPLEALCRLNVQFAEFCGNAVNQFLKEQDISHQDILFIASHGQTMYHISDHAQSSTLQIGDGSIIRTVTGIPVIFNFRMADISVGGQGAPLVPFFDLISFYHPQINRAVQNIGGIANVTVIPKQDIVPFAFDTGPGNMVIDECMRLLYNQEFDADGMIGRSGHPNTNLLPDLLEDPYFNLVPPKTTGREYFGQHYTKNLIQHMESSLPEDIIATATYLTAFSIRDAYQKFISPQITINEMIIGGGGVSNSFLIEILKKQLPEMKIMTHADFGINDHYKEAIAFAVLGYTSYLGIPNNLPYCTGAKQSIILGQITL